MNNVDGKVVIGTEINTTKFDKQIHELENKSRKLEREIEEKKKINVDTSQAEADLEKIRNKINSLSDKSVKVGLESVKDIEFSSSSVKNLQNISLQYGGINGKIEKMNGNLDYSSKNIKELKEDIKDINEESNDLPDKPSKISDGFKKGLKNVKQFALGLIGIRTAYSIISKASSSYLSQNEETATKLQNVWKVLGEAVGPVIDWLANSVLKLIGYINEFVKAFTGGKVDLVAKANARAIDNQRKSQEKLNKATQQYDFDVVRTQQDTSTSSDSSISSGLIEIPELNTKVVDKLKDMAYWLQENWKWIKEVGTILGIVFGAKAIANLLTNIGNLILNKTGGIGALKGSLVAIAAAWTISLYIKGYKEIKQNLDEAKKELSDMVEMEEYLTEKTKETNANIKEQVETNKLNDDQLNKIAKNTVRGTENIVASAKGAADQTHWYQKLLGLSKPFIKGLEEQNERVQDTAKLMGTLYEKGKISNEEYKKFIQETLPAFRKELNRAGVETETLDKVIASLPQIKTIEVNLEKEKAEESIEDINNNVDKLPNTKEINVEVTATDKTQSVLDKIKSGFASLGSAIGGIFGGGSGGKRFALGGIVTQPTRALIGEAGYNEYVLPEREDYLQRLASLIGQYSSGGGGATNVYLNGRLIQREMAKEENSRNFARNK